MVQAHSSWTSLIVMNLHLPTVPKKWQKLELAIRLNAMNMEDVEHLKNLRFFLHDFDFAVNFEPEDLIFLKTRMCEYDINFVTCTVGKTLLFCYMSY